MTDYFIFTRRTPRALNTIVSSIAPHLSRKHGTRKYSINWRNVERTALTADLIRHFCSVHTYDRGMPCIDLELAAVALLEAGYNVEHVPAYVNSDKVTRCAYLRITV